MEEYIRTVMEQIRCVRAREEIARELENHISDQADFYEAEGKSREEAVREAVRQMGDPVAAGVELDRVHRPQTDWKLLLMAVLFGLGGLVIQLLTGQLVSRALALRQCIWVAVGLALMAVIYFLDYSLIGKYAKELYWLLVAGLLVYMEFGASEVNGMYRGMIMPFYLFVPVFAGLLYQYRGKGYAGLLKCIAFLLLPVWLAWRQIPSLPTAFCLFAIFLCMLFLAAAKGWFTRARKKILLLLLGVGVILPRLFMGTGYVFLIADYQKTRIQAFVNPEAYASERGYIYCRIREVLAGCRWIGEGGELFEGFDGSYVLLRLVTSYGFLAAILVILALTALVLHIFHISLTQKNQLGLMAGTGCSLVFAIQITAGVAMNLGRFPSTTILFPFLTGGGQTTVVYYIFLGLLLGIYRNQNVLGNKNYREKWKISVSVQTPAAVQERKG